MNQRPLQELRLQDFRCFREQQTARLAPLTLLVGENSTGKTSFLAAVRAILAVASNREDPDFRTAPYDLGSFLEIAHQRDRDGRRSGAESFSIGLRSTGFDVESVCLEATFALGDGPAPTLSSVAWSVDDAWIREHRGATDFDTDFGCTGGSWRLPASTGNRERGNSGVPFSLDRILSASTATALPEQPLPLQGNAHNVPNKGDILKLTELCLEITRFDPLVFAGDPIGSSPLRTYDPDFSMESFLAKEHFEDPERWNMLKQKLEDFGKSSGLFDEIFVRRLGKIQHEPFQLEVRKWGENRKGLKRNVIDVGYGVSHVLPLLVFLVRPSTTSLFLLQQPEVHLHPSAQAALGSLFCTIAESGRQLIVETHSEYIVDRVRMDIRDRTTELKPEDVSVLFFERADLDVRIHSLRFDEQGNVIDAPDGYGQFFMDETRRSIGL